MNIRTGPPLKGKHPGRTPSDEENAMSETNAITEQQVREQAYALWAAAGSPEGAEVEFWYRAREALTRSSAARHKIQQELDEAGEESFPASDPVNRT